MEASYPHLRMDLLCKWKLPFYVLRYLEEEAEGLTRGIIVIHGNTFGHRADIYTNFSNVFTERCSIGPSEMVYVLPEWKEYKL